MYAKTFNSIRLISFSLVTSQFACFISHSRLLSWRDQKGQQRIRRRKFMQTFAVRWKLIFSRSFDRFSMLISSKSSNSKEPKSIDPQNFHPKIPAAQKRCSSRYAHSYLATKPACTKEKRAGKIGYGEVRKLRNIAGNEEMEVKTKGEKLGTKPPGRKW